MLEYGPMESKNVWRQLNKPIFTLAPMEDVTDTVFRQIIAACGKPDLFFTEFTNVEGLRSKGRARLEHRLEYRPIETPIIAQIWGRDPQNFYHVAQELAQRGFAGIDINMGCPERSIVKRGSCAGLINQPELAAEIIQAAREGSQGLPISVKTRCGIGTWVTQQWAEHLLRQNLDALIIHGRIAKEMSHYPANWQEIGKVVQARNQLKVPTIIIGNGDIGSYQDGLDKVQQYGLDGVMVGRGIFQNPWLFNTSLDTDQISHRQKLILMLNHVKLWQQTWGQADPDKRTIRNFDSLKKYYKIYTRDLPNATEIRAQLMSFNNAPDTISWLQQYVASLPQHAVESNNRHIL